MRPQFVGQIISVLICMLICARSAEAADVAYNLRSFGGRHAVLTLAGDTTNLTLHPSTDGMTVRISGVDVTFLTKSDIISGTIVRSVHQVRRGAVTDLVVNFSEPVTMSATPSSSGMQVLIRLARTGGATPVARATTDADVVRSVPFLVLWEQSRRPSRQPGQTIVVFPNAATLGARSSLTAGLHWFVYGLDLLWAWMSGERIDMSSFPADDTEVTPMAIEDSSGALLQQLTEEVLALREKVRELEEKAKQCAE